MQLARFVASEFGFSIENVMLLRHSNQTIEKLLAEGGYIEEYTYTQPTDDRKYDYYFPGKPRIKLLIVIVHDKVYGVYRVDGEEKEGTTYTLTSAAHRQFDIKRGRPERPASRYLMTRLESATQNLPVEGWHRSRTRTPTQRHDSGFFDEITVPKPERGWSTPPTPNGPIVRTEEKVLEDHEQAVGDASKDTSGNRKSRLGTAPRVPLRVPVTSWAFLRNPDVVAEVLERAGGLCELCGNPAPFKRKKDGTPYLEVHHKVRLADGGEDTIENAIALCPNCHRKEHYA